MKRRAFLAAILAAPVALKSSGTNSFTLAKPIAVRMPSRQMTRVRRSVAYMVYDQSGTVFPGKIIPNYKFTVR